MKYLFVYITTSNRIEAENISEAIISERLVACTNIVENMSALFWWDGGVQSEGEVILIAKTTSEAFSVLEERVRQIHSYECPCIIGMPIASGYQGYLDWIDEEVRPDSERQS